MRVALAWAAVVGSAIAQHAAPGLVSTHASRDRQLGGAGVGPHETEGLATVSQAKTSQHRTTTNMVPKEEKQQYTNLKLFDGAFYGCVCLLCCISALFTVIYSIRFIRPDFATVIDYVAIYIRAKSGRMKRIE